MHKVGGKTKNKERINKQIKIKAACRMKKRLKGVNGQMR